MFGNDKEAPYICYINNNKLLNLKNNNHEKV